MLNPRGSGTDGARGVQSLPTRAVPPGFLPDALAHLDHKRLCRLSTALDELGDGEQAGLGHSFPQSMSVNDVEEVNMGAWNHVNLVDTGFNTYSGMPEECEDVGF